MALTSSQLKGIFDASFGNGGNPPPVGGASTLDELTDVTITNPQTGQTLQWNGSQWVNAAGGTGSVTEASLSDVTNTLDTSVQQSTLANNRYFTPFRLRDFLTGLLSRANTWATLQTFQSGIRLTQAAAAGQPNHVAVFDENGNLLRSTQPLGTGIALATNTEFDAGNASTAASPAQIRDRSENLVDYTPATPGFFTGLVGGKAKIKAALDQIVTAIGQRANLVHTHTIADVTGLQTALDARVRSVTVNGGSAINPDVNGNVALTNIVDTVNNQTVGGQKTFSDTILSSTANDVPVLRKALTRLKNFFLSNSHASLDVDVTIGSGGTSNSSTHFIDFRPGGETSTQIRIGDIQPLSGNLTLGQRGVGFRFQTNFNELGQNANGISNLMFFPYGVPVGNSPSANSTVHLLYPGINNSFQFLVTQIPHVFDLTPSSGVQQVNFGRAMVSSASYAFTSGTVTLAPVNSPVQGRHIMYVTTNASGAVTLQLPAQSTRLGSLTLDASSTYVITVIHLFSSRTGDTPPTTAYYYFEIVKTGQEFSTGGGATNLDGLTDVTITSPSNNQILRWNGTQWVNSNESAGGVSTVFGRSGAVVAANNDYNAGQIQFTPVTGISDTNVQAALATLNGQVVKTTGDQIVAGLKTFSSFVTAPSFTQAPNVSGVRNFVSVTSDSATIETQTDFRTTSNNQLRVVFSDLTNGTFTRSYTFPEHSGSVVAVSDTEPALTPSAGTVTLNMSTRKEQYASLSVTENITFAITNPATTLQNRVYVIHAQTDASTRTITLPANSTWTGNVSTLSLPASSRFDLVVRARNESGTWRYQWLIWHYSNTGIGGGGSLPTFTANRIISSDGSGNLVSTFVPTDNLVAEPATLTSTGIPGQFSWNAAQQRLTFCVANNTWAQFTGVTQQFTDMYVAIPPTPTSTGLQGQRAYDVTNNLMYECVANNTWIRYTTTATW